MALKNSEKSAEQSQEKKELKDGREVQGGSPEFAMPNSLMIGMFAGGGENTNSTPTVFREFSLPNSQYLTAEDEADRLSAGVHGTNPDTVRREMGQRLNADFSGIRFHSDLFSESRAERMGARAWTSGRDVYFGKGGFEPRIAAHELVHTVQQGAASGKVSQNVAAGTVQMWPSWLSFGRRSNYEEDRSPSDIADSLFRIEAGTVASEEHDKAERNKAYAKAYKRALNQRGIEDPENADEGSLRAAKASASRAAGNLIVKKKDFVSKDDKRNFTQKIQDINEETYKEVLRRLYHAAEELCNFFEGINQHNQESVSKNQYSAANSKFGREFVVYDKLVRQIDSNHRRNPDFPAWKEQIQREGEDREDKLADARRIISSGNSRDNNYRNSAEGIAHAENAAKNHKDELLKIYGKKKTRLDRMAAVYRRNQENAIKILDDDLSSKGGSEDDNVSFYLTGMPEKIEETDSKGGGKKSEDINTSSKKKDNYKDNIFSNIIKEENEDNEEINIPVESVKNGIKSYISSDQGGMKENIDSEPLILDDESEIHQAGNVTDTLAGEFAPPMPTVSNIKNKTGKSSFVNNIVKQSGAISQIAIAGYNHELLNPNFSDPVSSSISAGSGVLGAMAGLSGTVTGTADTIRNIRNVKSGASHADWITSGLDTLGSAGSMTAGGLTAMKNAGSIPVIGDTLVNASGFGGANLIPGLNIATGGISMITGTIEGVRGGMGLRKINQQIRGLQGQSEGKMTKDQEKLLQIFKQGKRVAELHRTGGIIKTAGGGVMVATGIAVLASGPLAPITAAVLGIAGAAAGIGNFVYGRVKKKNMRKAATAEEMGFNNWEEEIKRVKNQFPDEKLSDSEAKEIILKGKGYDVKTRAEAMKQINAKRAKMLLDVAQAGGKIGKLAQKVISALGVHRKNGVYASGAQKLLAEKLGG